MDRGCFHGLFPRSVLTSSVFIRLFSRFAGNGTGGEQKDSSSFFPAVLLSLLFLLNSSSGCKLATASLCFFEGIDFLTDAIFDRLETYERDKKTVARMLSDGVDKTDVCKCLGIGKSELKALLAGNSSIEK